MLLLFELPSLLKICCMYAGGYVNSENFHLQTCSM
jgi:hypothetical protein